MMRAPNETSQKTFSHPLLRTVNSCGLETWPPTGIRHGFVGLFCSPKETGARRDTHVHTRVMA